MKKLLAVVAVLAALTGSLFAKENLLEVGVGYYSIPANSDVGYMDNAFSINLHTASMASEMIGVGSSVTFNIAPISGVSTLWLDAVLGVAIRPVNADKFALMITPGFDFNMYRMSFAGDAIMMLTFGPAVQVAASYKLTDSIYLTGNFDMAYDLYGFAVMTGYGSSSGSASLFTFNPQIGVTFKF